MHWRDFSRSLTTRGRSFVAGGLTATVGGVVVGERDLVEIGIFVVAVPLLASLWTTRAGRGLTAVRSMSSGRIEAGRTTQVQLRVTNDGPRTGVLLLSEDNPPELGPRPQFVMEGLRRGWHREAAYPITPALRGKFTVGPLRVHLGDPFGLVRLPRTLGEATALTVTPMTIPLPGTNLAGSWTGSGENRPRAFASGSAADVIVREYRLGDDLRRVHWRSSAKVGELMVRREEQPWQSRCTLMIDNRVGAHRGHGAGSSFEAAVSAAASIACRLAQEGYHVRLVTSTGQALGQEWHESGGPLDTGPILEQLAVLPLVKTNRLATEWIDESVSGGSFVAVLGAVDEHDHLFFRRIQSGPGSAYALVLGVDEWTRPDAPPGDRPASVDWLRNHGWKAVGIGRTDSLAAAWQGLSR